MLHLIAASAGSQGECALVAFSIVALAADSPQSAPWKASDCSRDIA